MTRRPRTISYRLVSAIVRGVGALLFIAACYWLVLWLFGSLGGTR